MMSSPELPDYAIRNRELWTESNAEYTGPQARDAWVEQEFTWGMFSVPESDVGILGDVAGKDVVELGCGTAYVSAWLARQGARPVGVDVTPAQLETARAMQREYGLEFPLVEAAAEDVPLPDASFDLAISEYGASLWADPDRWVTEAARLLRPGGELVFLTNSVLATLCMPEEGAAGERLLRSQFELGRLEWADGSIEFHLAHGEWIRMLRANG
ncbi:MAG: class I SAM-dependent methyltransferase, partial [Actinobacteria bacterium]